VRLRRTGRHNQFFLLARRLAPAGIRRPRGGVGLRGDRHRRPQLARRRRAGLCGGQEMARPQVPGRHASRYDRWIRGGRLSDRPGGLWPAVPTSQSRQSEGREGPMRHRLRRNPRGRRRPDFHRHSPAARVEGFRRPARAARPGRPPADLSRGR
ncbi:MAG: Error-prone repair homolog of DNA polymerase III alpha subunit, partial [uncultured Microvirga sp.]